MMIIFNWEAILLTLTILTLLITAGFLIFVIVKQSDLSLDVNKPKIWIICMLLLGGAVDAGYLTYVKLFHRPTACFITSGCDSVQTSRYSTLPGGIPVAGLGLTVFLLLGLLFLIYVKRPRWLVNYSALILPGIIAILVVNNLFLMGLNYLELAVLHALCSWCWLFAVINIGLSWIIIQDNLRGREIR
jgi:uncharacterized membrane protein